MTAAGFTVLYRRRPFCGAEPASRAGAGLTTMFGRLRA